MEHMETIQADIEAACALAGITLTVDTHDIAVELVMQGHDAQPVVDSLALSHGGEVWA